MCLADDIRGAFSFGHEVAVVVPVASQREEVLAGKEGLCSFWPALLGRLEDIEEALGGFFPGGRILPDMVLRIGRSAGRIVVCRMHKGGEH